jgi:hypothetical protein
MPLATQILRNGERLQLPWGDFHVACMSLAACFDSGTGPTPGPNQVYDRPSGFFDCYPDATFPVSQPLAFMLCSYPMLAKTPLGDGPYTLTRRHKFRDVVDGEILTLLPGDVLIAQRES